MASSNGSASARGTYTTSSEHSHDVVGPCHPAMWNGGNMHTDGPDGTAVASTRLRSNVARWDSSTPFGTPVLPLVKKMTCPSVSCTSGRSMPPVRREASSSSSRALSTTRSGSATSKMGPASSGLRRGLTGTNTAPSEATAIASAMVSRRVSPCHTTRE